MADCSSAISTTLACAGPRVRWTQGTRAVEAAEELRLRANCCWKRRRWVPASRRRRHSARGLAAIRERGLEPLVRGADAAHLLRTSKVRLFCREWNPNPGIELPDLSDQALPRSREQWLARAIWAGKTKLEFDPPAAQLEARRCPPLLAFTAPKPAPVDSWRPESSTVPTRQCPRPPAIT